MVAQTVGSVAGVEGLGKEKVGSRNLGQRFPDLTGLLRHLGTV